MINSIKKKWKEYRARPLSKFTTDGCSGGMTWAFNRVFGIDPPWNGCCVEHDKAYHVGGTWLDRYNADQKLMKQVSERGYPITAKLMYAAVRIGGSPYLPLPWRWCYGYPYPCKYSKYN